MFTNRLKDLHVLCAFIKRKPNCTKSTPAQTLDAYIYPDEHF